MLSVRNMLTESQQQQQPIEPNVNTSHVTLNEQLHEKKPSKLNISSLLCSNHVPEQPIQLPKPAHFHQLPPLQTQVYHYQQPPHQKPSNIAEGIQDDAYVHILWAKNKRLNQPPFHHYPRMKGSSNNYTSSSPTSPIFPQPEQQQQQQIPAMPHSYYLLNKHQRRSSRQHQIESKKIEQELLHDRSSHRKISSSSKNNYHRRNKEEGDDEEDEEDEEGEIPLKAKRRRASSKQLDVLNKVFERTFFPSTQLRAELGRQLGMSPRTVQIWFQNRRQAIRTKERTGSMTSSSRENSISPE